MYETAFGLDWTSIDREETIARGFALGVAESCGERHPDELDRLYEAVETTYDRSMVELAYHEGRRKSRRLRLEFDRPERIWEELVGGDLETAERASQTRSDSNSTAEIERAIPAVLARLPMLEPDDRSIGVIDRPGFLTRD